MFEYRVDTYRICLLFGQFQRASLDL